MATCVCIRDGVLAEGASDGLSGPVRSAATSNRSVLLVAFNLSTGGRGGRHTRPEGAEATDRAGGLGGLGDADSCIATLKQLSGWPPSLHGPLRWLETALRWGSGGAGSSMIDQRQALLSWRWRWRMMSSVLEWPVAEVGRGSGCRKGLGEVRKGKRRGDGGGYFSFVEV